MKWRPKLKDHQLIKFNVLHTIHSNAVTVHINGSQQSTLQQHNENYLDLLLTYITVTTKL